MVGGSAAQSELLELLAPVLVEAKAQPEAPPKTVGEAAQRLGEARASLSPAHKKKEKFEAELARLQEAIDKAKRGQHAQPVRQLGGLARLQPPQGGDGDAALLGELILGPVELETTVGEGPAERCQLVGRCLSAQI